MSRDPDNPEIRPEQIASALSRRVQQLIILPTEKCNFRCTYCYEDFAVGRMTDAVQTAIERFMDKRIPELNIFSIEWFGGEPLAARKVVLRLSAHASALCKANDVAFVGGLTTNAYVLDFDLFEELLSYEQRHFQITLDGWSDGHDAVRKLAGGGKTFDRIWTNLRETRRSTEEFTIKIRVHVRRDNYESLEILIDHLADAFGSDGRYHLDFQHLRDLGGKGGKSVDRPLSIPELRQTELRLRERYRDRLSADIFRSIDVPGVPDSASAPHTEICYAAKANSLLIRADGRIGKCTVALDDDRNTIGVINSDGTVSIDSELLKLWARGLASLDSKALECPLHGLPVHPASRALAGC